MRDFLETVCGVVLLPVTVLVLALLWVYRTADGLFGGGGRWLTILIGCYAIMFAFPLLFWPAVAGAWTVILIKGLGLGGYSNEKVL